MDHTIEELFREKNDKILMEKLLLDIDNNDDSLRLTINNKIELITSKLQKRLNNLLKLSNIDYDIKSLTDFLDSSKQSVREFVMKKLDDRKQFLKDNVKHDSLKLEESDNEKEKKELDELFNLGMNKIIYIDMLNHISTMYTFVNDSQKDELIEKCLKKYDFELTAAIQGSILERNISLRNVMKETNQKVNELNDKTTNKFLKKSKKSE